MDPASAQSGSRFGRRKREREQRLKVLAERNAMTHLDRVDNPGLPGQMFEHGARYTNYNEGVFRLNSAARVEFGEFVYVVQNARMIKSYIAVELPTALPNIVLDAISNQVFGVSSVSRPPAPDQHLSLEGDFDQSFRLYCLDGQEADALYLFTPDVMQNLMDDVEAFDVEIVDNWAILSTYQHWDRLDPATWQLRVRAAEAILAKSEQWRRWRDYGAAAADSSTHERESPDGSASETGSATSASPATNERLKEGIGCAGWVLGIIVALILGTLLTLPLFLSNLRFH